MRVYIETTVPSYVVARPARDLFQASRQQLARDWWEFERGLHELFTSQIVLDEAGAGDLAMARSRVDLLTWNCRHIANVAMYQRFRRIAESSGFRLPILCTPEEFMSYDRT